MTVLGYNVPPAFLPGRPTQIEGAEAEALLAEILEDHLPLQRTRGGEKTARRGE
jgi:hypothetical protein